MFGQHSYMPSVTPTFLARRAYPLCEIPYAGPGHGPCARNSRGTVAKNGGMVAAGWTSADWATLDPCGNTVLHVAALRGSARSLRYALDAGATRTARRGTEIPLSLTHPLLHTRSFLPLTLSPSHIHLLFRSCSLFSAPLLALSSLPLKRRTSDHGPHGSADLETKNGAGWCDAICTRLVHFALQFTWQRSGTGVEQHGSAALSVAHERILLLGVGDRILR
eukprot:2475501-Pleurochrysis_carterae.AAC.3